VRGDSYKTQPISQTDTLGITVRKFKRVLLDQAYNDDEQVRGIVKDFEEKNL